jgi:hypothetical protein
LVCVGAASGSIAVAGASSCAGFSAWVDDSIDRKVAKALALRDLLGIASVGLSGSTGTMTATVSMSAGCTGSAPSGSAAT